MTDVLIEVWLISLVPVNCTVNQMDGRSCTLVQCVEAGLKASK